MNSGLGSSEFLYLGQLCQEKRITFLKNCLRFTMKINDRKEAFIFSKSVESCTNFYTLSEHITIEKQLLRLERITL
jgi:hypothetical protein